MPRLIFVIGIFLSLSACNDNASGKRTTPEGEWQSSCMQLGNAPISIYINPLFDDGQLVFNAQFDFTSRDCAGADFSSDVLGEGTYTLMGKTVSSEGLEVDWYSFYTEGTGGSLLFYSLILAALCLAFP